MLILGAIVLVLTLVLYVISVAILSDLHGSDPAGNAMAAGFGTLAAIALWVFLVFLLLLAGAIGAMPAAPALFALVLTPASFASALACITLLQDRDIRFKWPLIVPALVPPLMIAFAIWAAFPSFHVTCPPRATLLFPWLPILILTVLPQPFITRRKRRRAIEQEAGHAQWLQEEAARKEQERLDRYAKFEKLPPDAPLWEWRYFTEHEPDLRERALAGIRNLQRRQADAEEILDKGIVFPMLELPNLDLQLTPALIAAAQKFLAAQAEHLVPRANPTPPFADVQHQIACYLPAIRWLTERGVNVVPELAAIADSIELYPKTPDRAQFLATLESLMKDETADERS